MAFNVNQFLSNSGYEMQPMTGGTSMPRTGTGIEGQSFYGISAPQQQTSGGFDLGGLFGGGGGQSQGGGQISQMIGQILPMITQAMQQQGQQPSGYGDMGGQPGVSPTGQGQLRISSGLPIPFSRAQFAPYVRGGV